MMYIEHPPLEENYQDALGISTLLAHDSEVTHNRNNTIHSQLHLSGTTAATQERLFCGTYEAANFRLSPHRRSGSDSGVIALCNGTTNGIRFFEDNDKKKYSGGNRIKDYIDQVEKVESIPRQRIVDDEEEQGEDYELLEVFDIDKDKILKTEEKKPESQELLSVNNKEEEEAPFQIILQIEDEGENTEYILHRLEKPNQKIKEEQLKTPCGGTNKHKFQGFQTRACPIARPIRPIPAAIPICKPHNTVSSREQQTHRPNLINKRILNGNLSLSADDFNHQISNNISSYQEVHKQYQYQTELPQVGTGRNSPSENIESNLQYNQMGILNKLRQLLNLTLGPNNTVESEKHTRKRRSEDINVNKLNPQLTKYRKVDSRFPELYTNTEEDDLELISQFAVNQSRNQNILPKSFPNRMAEQRAVNPFDAPKMRKSMFVSPEKTRRIVKNTYADVEFSDDDDLEMVKAFGIDTDARNASTSGSASKSGPKVYNIPVRHYRTEMGLQQQPQQHLQRHATAKPPPPLIEACSGNVLLPALVPQVDLVRKSTAEDILAQKNNLSLTNTSHLMGQPVAGSTSSSSDSLFASSAYRNFSSKSGTNPWSTNARSILAQEKESDERKKYRQLLEQLVPRLYGTENENRKLTKSYTRPRDLHPTQRDGLFSENFANITALSGRKPLSVCTGSQQIPSLRRPPLSSTINLDDDEEEDDVAITGITSLTGHRKNRTPKDVTMVIIDDDDVSEIVDLDEEEHQVVSACSKLKSESLVSIDLTSDRKKGSIRELPYVEPVNSLEDRFKASPHIKDNWLINWQSEWSRKKNDRRREVDEASRIAEKLALERRLAEHEIGERLKKFQIVDPNILVIDDFPEPLEDAEPEFVLLTADHQARISAAIRGPADQVLVDKFRIKITRRDISTLQDHNWLNDQVINFYMNLITERGEKKCDSHGLPSVYAMNTFFMPRLMEDGFSGVKRWTRKVDIFAKDIIPVPVHVGRVHWCMAVIHMKNRTIKYYDSMGTPNPNVLRALEQYLKDESLDKRQQPFDTSQFQVESVQDVPRQMNGSDCGVFSCMFAEYVTRNKKITFSQQDMEYFRHKMILEIVQGELLQ